MPVTLGLPKGRSSGRTDIHQSPPSAETTALKCKLNNTLIWPHSNQVYSYWYPTDLYNVAGCFFLNKNVFIQLMGFKKLLPAGKERLVRLQRTARLVSTADPHPGGACTPVKQTTVTMH